ncbi:hypothetical protein [Lacunimicrobium album]
MMAEQDQSPELRQDSSSLFKVLGVSAAITVVTVIVVYSAIAMSWYGMLIGLACVIVFTGAIVIVLAYRSLKEKSEEIHPILDLIGSIFSFIGKLFMAFSI